MKVLPPGVREFTPPALFPVRLTRPATALQLDLGLDGPPHLPSSPAPKLSKLPPLALPGPLPRRLSGLWPGNGRPFPPLLFPPFFLVDFYLLVLPVASVVVPVGPPRVLLWPPPPRSGLRPDLPSGIVICLWLPLIKPR